MPAGPAFAPWRPGAPGVIDANLAWTTVVELPQTPVGTDATGLALYPIAPSSTP